MKKSRASAIEREIVAQGLKRLRKKARFVEKLGEG